MENKEKNIGIFDSGIGGLTVVKSILARLPWESIVYFGDTAHVPYGTRSREQIIEYALNDVRFLNRFNVKAVVIACNTADSIARAAVEQAYPGLPVFGVVGPASERAAAATRNGRIGVIATNATVDSGAYEKAISALGSSAFVFSVACPLLVPLVEEGRFHRGDNVIIRVLTEYLAPLREKGVDTLVLGCTHYPLLHDLIADIMGDGVEIISSSVAAADKLAEKLGSSGLLSSSAAGERRFFVSDNAAYFEKQARIFMGEDLTTPVLHDTGLMSGLD